MNRDHKCNYPQKRSTYKSTITNMATMRTYEVICNKCQVILFYKLHLCSLASSLQQQNNNNIIVIVVNTTTIVIIIITALEPKVDEMGRKAVWFFLGRGVWRCVFGRVFPDVSNDGLWKIESPTPSLGKPQISRGFRSSARNLSFYWGQFYTRFAKEEGKVKWSRCRPCVTQRVGRGIALLFHDSGNRRGWVVSSTPRPHFTLFML